jgi:hypothetical protein
MIVTGCAVIGCAADWLICKGEGGWAGCMGVLGVSGVCPWTRCACLGGQLCQHGTAGVFKLCSTAWDHRVACRISGVGVVGSGCASAVVKGRQQCAPAVPFGGGGSLLRQVLVWLQAARRGWEGCRSLNENTWCSLKRPRKLTCCRQQVEWAGVRGSH